MSRPRLLSLLVLAAALAYSSALVAGHAFGIFDFFDMSTFMDAGYRVWKGQRIYEDFFYNTGPIHPHLHAFSFALLGFGRDAVLLHLVVMNALALFALHLVARRTLPPIGQFIVLMVAGTSFYGPAAHPWYDQNAAAWLFLGLALMEAVPGDEGMRPAFGGRRAAAAAAGAGFLTSLAALTKLNVGLCGLILFLPRLAFAPGRGRLVACYAAGFAAGCAGLFLLASPVAMFENNFLCYRPFERLFNLGRLVRVALLMPPLPLVLASLLMAALAEPAWRRAHRATLTLSVSIAVAATLCSFTGSLVDAASQYWTGAGVLYGAILLSRWSPTRRAPALSGPLVRFACLALVVSLMHLAARATADHAAWRWRTYFRDGYELRAPGLEGWRCDPEVGAGFDAAVEHLRRHVPADSSLLVFPDATVMYGVLGRESFRPEAPIGFSLGSFPAGAHYDRFGARFRSAPPDWILMHDERDFERMDTFRLLRWLGLDTFIAAHYDLTASWPRFELYRRKPAAIEEASDR